jgi:three-Cys-motif partner protein
MAKQNAKNTVQPHSQAKLDFFESYLFRYLSILVNLKRIKHINIYDPFCGRGLYENDSPGSPILAVRCIREIRKKFPAAQTPIRLFLRDSKKSYIDGLNRILSIEGERLEYDLDIMCSGLENPLTKIKEELDKQPQNAHNLVFVDPYGWKYIDKSTIHDFLKLGNYEIILWQPINSIYRFGKPTKPTDKDKRSNSIKKFIQEFFPDRDVKQVFSSQDSLVANYTEEIKPCPKYYSTFLKLKTQRGATYSIFFATPHIYGLEKANEAKWRVDPSYGTQFCNHNTPFEATPNLSRLRETLKSELETKKRMSNIEIYEITITSGFLPKHARELLRGFKKEKLIVVLPSANAKTAHFRISYKAFKSKIYVEFKWLINQ